MGAACAWYALLVLGDMPESLRRLDGVSLLLIAMRLSVSGPVLLGFGRPAGAVIQSRWQYDNGATGDAGVVPGKGDP